MCVTPLHFLKVSNMCEILIWGEMVCVGHFKKRDRRAAASARECSSGDLGSGLRFPHYTVWFRATPLLPRIHLSFLWSAAQTMAEVLSALTVVWLQDWWPAIDSESSLASWVQGHGKTVLTVVSTGRWEGAGAPVPFQLIECCESLTLSAASPRSKHLDDLIKILFFFFCFWMAENQDWL